MQYLFKSYNRSESFRKEKEGSNLIAFPFNNCVLMVQF